MWHTIRTGCLVLGAGLVTACGGGSSDPPLPELQTVVTYGSLLGKYTLTLTDKYPKKIDTLELGHTGTDGDITFTFADSAGAVQATPPVGTMKPGETATVAIEAVGLSFTTTQLTLRFTYARHGSTDQFTVPFQIVTNEGRFPGEKLENVLTLTPPAIDRYLLTPEMTFPLALDKGSIKYTAATGLPVRFQAGDQLRHLAAAPGQGTLEAVEGKPSDPKRSAEIAVSAADAAFGVARLIVQAEYDVVAHNDRLRATWSIRNVAPPHLAALLALKVLTADDPLLGQRFWKLLKMAPYGEVVTHPSDPKLNAVPSLKYTEIELVGSTYIGLTAKKLTDAFWSDKKTRGGSGEALFPPGFGRNGFTLHPEKELPQAPGDYFLVHMTVENSVPLKDTEPKNNHAYTFAFDSDLLGANNYVPGGAVPNDYHKGTDRWYEAQYDATNGWKFTVQQTSGDGSSHSETSSAARLIITDNSIVLVVPISEFPAAWPAWRGATFVYQPGSSVWSGDVMPKLADPLLATQ